MHRKLREYALSKGYTAEKNLFYGRAGDVYVTASPGTQTSVTLFYFSMSCPVSKAEEPIRAALKELRLFKRPKIEQKGSYITVLIANTGKALREESLDALIKTVIDTAKQNGVTPNTHCVQCAKETNDIALFNGAACPVCADCVRDIDELNRNSGTSPVFYLTGLIGAALGAAIGAIPWIIAYTMGWILGILAFVIGMGAFYGYKLFKGPRNRAVALVTIYAVSLFAVLAFYGVIAFFALVALGEVTSLVNIVQTLTSDVSVLLEILLALVLALAGIVGVNKKIATYTIPRNARVIARRGTDANRF
ncbi:MAG: hypothetical protein LBT12_06445 [Oscillospiraceae bacterium]|jgi:hypothetical protein|nr:hypothetical protein [Oscillospiraceae bacterium]